MRSSIFHHVEKTDQENKGFVMQNDHMLLVNLDGEVYAKQGAMAAYQGDIDFEYHGGGVSRTLKKVFTGEDLRLMKCKGRGDLFLADNGAEIFSVELNNEQITLNSNNVLAFDSNTTWDINRIKAGVMGIAAGGLFNVTLTGTGNVAVTSWGKPVVISVDQPVAADSNRIIAWSSSLRVDIKTTLKAGMIIGRSSGEAVQMLFSGHGFVIVQPGEGLAAMLTPASS